MQQQAVLTPGGERDKKLVLETALLYVKGTHQLVLFIAYC